MLRSAYAMVLVLVTGFHLSAQPSYPIIFDDIYYPSLLETGTTLYLSIFGRPFRQTDRFLVITIGKSATWEGRTR